MKGQLRLLGGRKLLSPSGIETRPTTARVREALINLLGDKLNGCNWLDLFSGSGVISCEVLQRGAKKIVAVDIDKKSAHICKKNLQIISNSINTSQTVHVIRHEVNSWLEKGYKNFELKAKNNSFADKKEFDFVYLDPPYRSKIYTSVMVNLLKGQWVKDNSMVVLEHNSSLNIDIPSGWVEKDRRNYGATSLLFLNPPRGFLYDIDSMHLQRGPTT